VPAVPGQQEIHSIYRCRGDMGGIGFRLGRD
jgi:hypothetical protein